MDKKQGVAVPSHGWHRLQLWQAMIERTPVGFPLAFGLGHDWDVAEGLIQSIEAENGSGMSFNVVVTNRTEHWTVYVRCEA